MTDELKLKGTLIWVQKVKKLTLTNCTFSNNIGTYAAALVVYAYGIDVDSTDSGNYHLTITGWTFENNGSTEGSGVIWISFPSKLQNVLIDGNSFTDNSAHLGSSIVSIIH